MSSIRSLAALLAVCAIGCGKDKDAESAESTESAGGEAAQLKPEEAKAMIGGIVAREMCKPEGYFASCGTFQPGECEQNTLDAFNTCADQNPSWLERLDDESSQALGVCTGKGALLKVAGEGRLSIDGPCANPEQFP